MVYLISCNGNIDSGAAINAINAINDTKKQNNLIANMAPLPDVNIGVTFDNPRYSLPESIVMVDTIAGSPYNKALFTWSSDRVGDYIIKINTTDCSDGQLIALNPEVTIASLDTTVSSQIHGVELAYGGNIVSFCLLDTSVQPLPFVVKKVNITRVRPTCLNPESSLLPIPDPIVGNYHSKIGDEDHDFKLFSTAATPKPLVIILHGGGFQNRNNVLPIAEALSEQLLDYASIAMVNYRLVQTNDPDIYTDNTNTFPAANSDLRCAIRYFKKHSAQYNIDPNRIIPMGLSAGGNIALMLALASDAALLDDGTCPADLEGYSASVKGAVSFWGPADFRLLELNNFPPGATPNLEVIRGVVSDYLGIEYGEAGFMDAALNASPVKYLDASDPNIFIVHSNLDPTCPFGASRALSDSLTGLGVRAGMVEKDDARHSAPIGLNITDTADERSGYCTMLQYLYSQLFY